MTGHQVQQHSFFLVKFKGSELVDDWKHGTLRDFYVTRSLVVSIRIYVHKVFIHFLRFRANKELREKFFDPLASLSHNERYSGETGFRFSDFLFFALFQEVTTNITIHYKSKKKWNNKLHKSSKMKCAQWPKELFLKIGFWVGHYHVQLTGVDIYIKTRSDV